MRDGAQGAAGPEHARRLRVLVAEPSPLIADLLSAPLRGFADVTIHGGGVDGVQAAASGAEVLVVGPGLVTAGLVAVVPRLLSAGTRTLVVSSGPLDRSSSALLLAGASGFLPDADTSPPELADAVRQVASGSSALHPDVVHAVLSEWRAQRAPAASAAALTSRELDVLSGLSDGLTTRQLAARLGVAEKTVEAHKSRLFAKLGVRNQSQAVQAGAELGLLIDEERRS